MRNLLPSVFAAALVLAPAAALAQYVVPEPPLLPEASVAIVTPDEMVAPVGPLTEEDAAQIAMMHGMAVVDDVDLRIWDGNFEVEGQDATGEDLEIRIDHDTGQVLEIDN